MIGLEDRQALARDIEQAHRSDARLRLACETAGVVPMPADEGVYLASESTFARVLREHGQNTHRGRARAPQASRSPTTHVAQAPG